MADDHVQPSSCGSVMGIIAGYFLSPGMGAFISAVNQTRARDSVLMRVDTVLLVPTPAARDTDTTLRVDHENLQPCEARLREADAAFPLAFCHHTYSSTLRLTQGPPI